MDCTVTKSWTSLSTFFYSLYIHINTYKHLCYVAVSFTFGAKYEIFQLLQQQDFPPEMTTYFAGSLS